jgi:hypothetical protein
MIFISPVISQALSLEEILDKTQKAVQIERNKIDTYIYEYTEKTVFTKLDKKGQAEEADTTISRIRMKGYDRLSEEIIYSRSKAKKEKSDDKKDNEESQEFTVGIDVELSADNPDYIFEMTDETDREYVISITPRKKKPDRGQVKGKYFIDKESFLIKTMNLEVPRPKKTKELKMHFAFTKLDDGPYVMTDMEMQGRVRVLFGVINIRFHVFGEFYDYKVLKKIESE